MGGVCVSFYLRVRQLSLRSTGHPCSHPPCTPSVCVRFVDAGAHHSVGHARTLVNNSTSARTVAEDAELLRYTMICKALLPLMLVGGSEWLRVVQVVVGRH